VTHHVDRYLGNLVEPRAGGGESTADIGEHLVSLRRQVTRSDEVSLFVFGFLTGDEHQPSSRRDYDMAVRRRCRQFGGIDALERHCPTVRSGAETQRTMPADGRNACAQRGAGP
jgi:hypothetical protein